MQTTSSSTRTSSQSKPFGPFERMVARRYLGATRKGAGVSLITIIAFSLITLSVALMIVVMSVFQGFRINILDQLLSVSGHVFVTSTDEPLTDYEAQAAELRALPGVVRATPVLRVETYAVGQSGEGLALVQGLSPEDVRSLEKVAGEGHIRQGNFLTFGEGKNGGNEIALGSSLAANLGVWVGDSVTLVTAGGVETPFGQSATTQKAYKVGAIFQIGNSAFDQYYAYMPLEQAQLFARKKGEVSEIEIRVEDALNIDPYLGAIRVSVGPTVSVQDWRFRNSDIFNALQVERGLQRIILLMIVAVAVVNIISGLVMLVKDKRSDIAVLRTMGASQGSVMRIFMLVGASIGVTGALCGVALGALIATNLGAIESFLSSLFWFRFFNPNIYYLSEIP
ncbi:MAG: ABC transporter permease, partial [Pseudomonadota bacterium]